MIWEKVKLKDFLTNRESRFKPSVKEIEGLKRIDKIDFSGQIFVSNKPSNTDMILVKDGDLVISGINVEKGAMAVYQGDEDITATIHYSSYKFDINKIDIDFLKLFLKSAKFKEALKEQVPGGIKTEIKSKHLLPLEVIIPTSLKEQREVVKKHKAQNLKLNLLTNEYLYQHQLLKKLRQQIIQDAIQGKITESWRKENPSVEPASVLIEKIKAEKERLIKENKVKKNKSSRSIKNEEVPFDIPDSWEWCRLGEIITFGPSNGYSPRESKKGVGIKCLTLTATTSGQFKGEFYKLVDVIIEKDSYLWLKPDDILIQRGNSIDYVGIAAIYNGKPNEYIYPDLMIKIKVSKEIYSNYIYYVLVSNLTRKYFQSNAFGAQKSMPKINQGVVINTLIPLPPLSEQHRIVQKLEQFLNYRDDLEENIKQNQAYTEQLLQVALKEALEPKEVGELVEV